MKYLFVGGIADGEMIEVDPRHAYVHIQRTERFRNQGPLLSGCRLVTEKTVEVAYAAQELTTGGNSPERLRIYRPSDQSPEETFTLLLKNYRPLP